MRNISASSDRRAVITDDPESEALIDLIADLFISTTNTLPIDESAHEAALTAQRFGHNRGWTTATIRDYELRVARRVAWRLAALRRRG